MYGKTEVSFPISPPVMKSSQLSHSMRFGTKKKCMNTFILCITGAIIGAKRSICEDDMVILSPGTMSMSRIGVSSPMFMENFRSCDRSNVFELGLFTEI